MDNLYEDLVARHSKHFIPVKIPKDKVERIKLLVQNIKAVKANEGHHIVDDGNEEKRFFTGLMGEAALEELLGINIIEWTFGDSSIYNHPDIKELGVGIKTVERNKFPVIFKNNRYPQIICIVSDKVENVVFVCGLATMDVLNRYQSDLLILSKELYERKTKTGFYGFFKLKRINCVEDIKKYLTSVI